MSTFRLPVSKREVSMRLPTGAEDLLLVEAPAYDTAFALELLRHLLSCEDAAASLWSDLCITDLDALLLHLRVMVFGNIIRTDVLCPQPDCGQRIDVTLHIDEFLAYHRLRKAHNVDTAEEAGWFNLRDTAVSFRLLQANDRIIVTSNPGWEHELIRRCIRPADVSSALVKRVARAMEALAPNLSGNLQGLCHECGSTVAMYFDVQHFVLQELREQAAFIYEDIHLLATHYHWTQAEIIVLPRNRRASYIALLRQERSLV